MSSRTQPKTRGFTLLEVMVAIAIFALGSVSVLAIRTNSYREARAARDYNTARYLLQVQMEEVLLEPKEFEDGDEGEFEDIEDEAVRARYTWRVELEEINLLGGEDDEEEEIVERASRRRNDDEDDSEGGGLGDDGGFGGEDEEEEIRVWRVQVSILYPGRRGEVSELSATTYLPGEAIEDEGFF